MDRRKFISSIGRGTILAGITALSGALVYKSATQTGTCDFDFVCRNCGKLKACKQPEAIIFKRKQEKDKSVK